MKTIFNVFEKEIRKLSRVKSNIASSLQAIDFHVLTVTIQKKILVEVVL